MLVGLVLTYYAAVLLDLNSDLWAFALKIGTIIRPAVRNVYIIFLSSMNFVFELKARARQTDDRRARQVMQLTRTTA